MKTIPALVLAAFAFALPHSARAEGAEEKKAPAPSKTPEECYTLACKALCEGDGDTYWFCLSKATRKQLISQAEEAKKNHAEDVAAQLKVKVEDLEKIEPRDIALRQVLAMMNDEVRKMLKEQKISNVKVDGDKATATLRNEGEDSPIEFVKEDEGWRINTAEDDAHDDEKK